MDPLCDACGTVMLRNDLDYLYCPECLIKEQTSEINRLKGRVQCLEDEKKSLALRIEPIEAQRDYLRDRLEKLKYRGDNEGI